MNSFHRVCLTTFLLQFCHGAVQAESSPITFAPLHDPDISGYSRVPSPAFQKQLGIWQATLTEPINIFVDPLFWVQFPVRSRGMPGVVAFDYDRDGDIDLYVSNGPGAPNRLLSNQFKQTGVVDFVDVTSQAGVALTAHDTSGVCAGDIDNDGDQDLFAVGNNEASVLFENRGDGTFRNITAAAGIDDSGRTGGSSCQFGDIDNDGLLELLVVRFEDQFDHEACNVAFHPDNQANDLWKNRGNRTFTEISDTSGIRAQEGGKNLSHSAGFVDIDEDGDVDVVIADDQCGPFPEWDPVYGVERGFMQVFINDGSGQFTATTSSAGTQAYGAWMGLTWGDYDLDGHLDFFSTNGGGYGFSLLFPPGFWQKGWQTSRMFLGHGDGTFTDRRWPYEPGFSDTSVFGWSAHSEDFDLDGDTDILYFGGLDNVTYLDRSNPGTIIANQGDGTFAHGGTPFQLRHAARNVHGSATADFDNDGRVDVVSVSNHDVPSVLPLFTFASAGVTYNADFDATASLAPYGTIDASGNFVWNGVVYPNGTLKVDLNTTEGSRGHVKVTALGSVGIVDGAIVNRDGIGSIISVTPENGRTNRRPTGQATYMSQDERTFTAGLGNAERATVDIFWPGAVRNRLYNVSAGEQVVFPEIPCSFDDDSLNTAAYRACVESALDDLVSAKVLTPSQAGRFRASALRARAEYSQAS